MAVAESAVLVPNNDNYVLDLRLYEVGYTKL